MDILTCKSGTPDALSSCKVVFSIGLSKNVKGAPTRTAQQESSLTVDQSSESFLVSILLVGEMVIEASLLPVQSH